uniref:Minor capsid protein VP2 n=1 Tax=Miniopterus bat polyomavirus TaxID=3141924 RepID=A0AAU7E2C0_9POLY
MFFSDRTGGGSSEDFFNSAREEGGKHPKVSNFIFFRMGGVLTLLMSIGEIATELTATTGLTLETILTGEALAALEAEIASVMTIQGISGIEALAQLGFTAEQFSNMALVASLVNEGIAYGTVFQTVSGLSALVAAGVRLGLGEVSNVNRRLLHFAGDNIITHTLLSFPLDQMNWGDSIIHALGGETIRSNQGLRNLILNARWVIQTESAPPDANSGNMIDFYHAPGGTHQQTTPDWMLPLILGLSGDQTPELKYLQDAYQKKSR